MEQQITKSSSVTMNLSTTERVVSVLGGGYLLINSLTGKNFGLIKTLTAGFLLFRGATGYCPAYKALGKTDVYYKGQNVNIKTSLTVNKPRHEVYAFWRQLENLPLFMKHLKSVTVVDETRSDWEANIPGGLGSVKWRSEIVRDEPGEMLSWQSIQGSSIENAGKVEFKDAGKFGTEVYAVISYHAPLGVVGEGVARLLNPLFENMVKEDIKNFKRYIETGEVPTTEGQPAGRTSISKKIAPAADFHA